MTGDVLEQRDIAFHLPDGQGLVFDPNPVVTANNNTLRDPTATVASCGFAGTAQATIDAQRVTRTLRDLTLAGGVHKLDGPFVKITAPAESKPGDEFLIHLVERNRAGQVIGGIRVQVNVVAR